MSQQNRSGDTNNSQQSSGDLIANGGQRNNRHGQQRTQQGRQHQQRGEASQPQGGRPPQGGREGGSQDDSRFTRRRLLIGGGVAAAGAGGGWSLFFRGPSGAIGIADNYISAVRNNSWRSAGDLFHEDAPPMQTIDDTDGMSSYEDFLSEQQGGFNSDRSELDIAESLSPSVNSHEEFSHYPEWNQEVAENAFVSGPSPDNTGIADEVKLIFTTLEVDASTWYGDDSDEPGYLSGNTTTVFAPSTVVLSGGDWSLWNAPDLGG